MHLHRPALLSSYWWRAFWAWHERVSNVSPIIKNVVLDLKSYPGTQRSSRSRTSVRQRRVSPLSSRVLKSMLPFNNPVIWSILEQILDLFWPRKCQVASIVYTKSCHVPVVVWTKTFPKHRGYSVEVSSEQDVSALTFGKRLELSETAARRTGSDFESRLGIESIGLAKIYFLQGQLESS